MFERTRRWAKRNPTVAVLGSAVAALLVVIAVGSTLSYTRLARERRKTLDALARTRIEARRADQKARESEQNYRIAEAHAARADANLESARGFAAKAEANLNQAKANESLAQANLRKSLTNEERARNNLAAANRQTELAEDRRVEVERQLYYNNITIAHSDLILSDSVGRASQLLDACPPKLRGWEWYYCKRLCEAEIFVLHGHEGEVKDVVFSPDGELLASAGADHAVMIWDARTGRRLNTLIGHTAAVTCLAFDPDPESGHLASGDANGVVKFWNNPAHDKHALFVLKAHIGPVNRLAYTTHHGFLASAGRDGRVILWNPTRGFDEGENFEAFKMLDLGRIQLTLPGGEVERGDQLWSLSKLIFQHPTPVRGLAFAPSLPDETTLTMASSDEAGTTNVFTIKPYEIQRQFGRNSLGVDGIITKKAFFATPDHHLSLPRSVHGLAFGPGGVRLALACDDRKVRIWDHTRLAMSQELIGHIDRVRGVTIHPDGFRLASAGADGTVRVWSRGRTKGSSAAGTGPTSLPSYTAQTATGLPRPVPTGPCGSGMRRPARNTARSRPTKVR